MDVIKRETYHVGSRSFELCLCQDDQKLSITVFENGKQIGVTYSVQNETLGDAWTTQGIKLAEELLTIAKSDLDRRLYI